MPVILAPQNHPQWLDLQAPLAEIQSLIAPCSDALIAMHPVSLVLGKREE